MKNRILSFKSLLSLFTLLVSAWTLTNHCVLAADLSIGQELARQCSACHGKNGIAVDPESSNLAGQPAIYLEKALKDYKSGARQDRRMTLIAEPLSIEEIKALAAWYSSFTVEVTPPQ